MRKLLLIYLLFISTIAISKENFWKDINVSQSKSTLQYDYDVEKFRTLKLDIDGLKKQLRNNLKKSGNNKIILPIADKGFATFVISEYNIMEKKLSDKFPQIKTFHGYNEQFPAEKIYLDITQKGLHAMTLGGEDSIWIDPVSRSSDELYISYKQEDYVKKVKRPPFYCKTHGRVETSPTFDSQKNLMELPKHENEVRTFRLAVSTIAEYTVYHSKPKAANKADGLAAVVTAMTRLNGVFESNIAVRMILIGDNDKLIWTDPMTDPFTDVDSIEKAGQNQISTDQIIGDANYDIGHVFTLDGAGFASFGSLCEPKTEMGAFKAQAAAGTEPPVGDAFLMSYVAHEFGHQLYADHTFNYCLDVWAGSGTSYEVGSGSTIMSYAGVCKESENVENRADGYYHAKSISVMDEFVDNVTTRENKCGIIVNTNNKAPVVSVTTGHSIPKSTPFELCASATDADSPSNQLTYGWEQYDLGTEGTPPNMPSGNTPIFRSFPPTTNPCRTFPKIATLTGTAPPLVGSTPSGETLPSYARSLNFRVTVMDNNIGGGAFNTSAMSMTVTNDGPFLLTSPNGTEVLNHGGNMDVTWDVAGTNTGAINCPNVDISASNDGGFTFPFTLLATTPNDGSQEIPVPAINSNKIRFKIKCSNSVFFDISNSNLQINSTVAIDTIYKNGFETNN